MAELDRAAQSTLRHAAESALDDVRRIGRTAD
jgi:hypothetical protein